MDFGPFAVAIAFWIFVAVASVAGIVARLQEAPGWRSNPCALRSRRASSSTRRWSSASWPGERHGVNPLGLRIAGIITLSAGVGIAVLAFFIDHVAPVAFYPVLGGGVVAVCVGAGLLVAARARRALRQPARKARTGRVSPRSRAGALGQAAEATVVALAMRGDARGVLRARAPPPVRPAQPAAAPQPRSGARGRPRPAGLPQGLARAAEAAVRGRLRCLAAAARAQHLARARARRRPPAGELDPDELPGDGPSHAPAMSARPGPGARAAGAR